MKKSLLIISSIILYFGSIGKAQENNNEETDPREKLALGIKAGLNYSNVWDERGQDFRADAKVGFAGGVFLGIPIGKFLGIQPEILVSQKGFQGSGTLLGSPYSFTRTTTYIDVPLQLQLKPIKQLTIVAGPQYSYLMTVKNTYTLGANSVEQEEEFENDNIRKNILGLVAGADININHFVLGARLGWDIQNNNGDGTSTTPRYKNAWYQATIGYRFYN